ncbi:hypothetical protein GQ464_013735 [Rhodocaloribacter litoris]|uniref:hypothetical protein n=1 Tax=Rhodocaloribacter litoris TaxID=2558931 RepID=UPI001422E95D|nr:hypothetical protein [Rhodocaloribacter litoris]QXD14485.1 hypothetical protein GQ464_013735 [Rhodocaloribacter litoris]
MSCSPRRLLPVLPVLCLLLGTPATHAQPAPGSFGLGGQIGEPSGITLKLYRSRSVSYDFLAAWDLDDFFFLNVHLLNARPLGREREFHVFFGPGAFIGILDRPRFRDDEVVVGLSGQVGLGLFIERFELFVQLTPRLSLLPATDGDLGGGLGARYLFD